MRKIALVFLSLIVGLNAFAKHKKNKQTPKKGNSILSVQLFRTGCFGQCPTYIVEIANDGIATYSAIRFNDDSGIFKKDIGKAKAQELLNEVNSYQPDTCKDEYDTRVADLPGINLQIKYTNKTKKIMNAKDGPAFLRLLANHIDAAGKKTDNTGWTKVTGKGK